MKAISNRQASECPEYLLKSGELLITTDGTVGRVHVVTDRMAGWFGSNNMARLNDEHTDMGFLCAFLHTPFGTHQLCREIYGGVIDHINERHISSVMVPVLNRSEQTEIGNQIRKAFQLKEEANLVEDAAIASVECMILGT
jgi:type I restriction enzyme S subunit